MGEDEQRAADQHGRDGQCDGYDERAGSKYTWPEVLRGMPGCPILI
jgi:hypothetical protein